MNIEAFDRIFTAARYAYNRKDYETFEKLRKELEALSNPVEEEPGCDESGR